MKNWADHCSSDEESMDHELDMADQMPEEDHADDADLLDEHEHHDMVAGEEAGGDEAADDGVNEGPPAKQYDWPTEAPFTAYVGNLSYKVDQASLLADEIVRLAKEKLSMEVNVVGSRLSRVNQQHNRRGDNGQQQQQQQRAHRGFGYVELETLEQLKAVVEGLGGGMIAGRAIQLDTANLPVRRNNMPGEGGPGGNNFHRNNNNNRQFHQRDQHQSHSQVDGTKFRGGRHLNNDNNNNNNRDNNHNRPRRHGGDRQQQQSQNNQSSSQGGDEAPGQRPSLKLQPRSKPLEGESGGAGNKPNIFGAGRARDEQNWRERKKTTPTEKSADTNNASDADGEQEQDPPQQQHQQQHDRRGPRTRGGGNDNRRNNNAGRGGGAGGNTFGPGGAGGRGGRKEGGGRGGAGKTNQQPHEEKKTNTQNTTAATKVTTPEKGDKQQKPPAVVNRFAALGIDSDSD